MQYITIALTPFQAAIVDLALQEYQSDFEAQINATEISDLRSINDAADYIIVAEECSLIRKAIEIQSGINL